MRKFTNLKMSLLGVTSLITGGTAFGQSITVTDQVMDPKGEKQSGANILIKCTAFSTVTNTEW